MAPIGTLWGARDQPQTKVILTVAALNGFELHTPERTSTTKPVEFTSKFTYGMAPTFQGVDGFKLMEGSAIAHYLCSIGSVNLLGSTPTEAAVIDQWMHFTENEIGIVTLNILGSIDGSIYTYIPEVVEKNYKRLDFILEYVDKHLASRSSGYVALDTLSLADLVLAGNVWFASCGTLGAAERAQYPHVYAHYDKVTADDRWKAYWGKESFVDVRRLHSPPNASESHQASSG